MAGYNNIMAMLKNLSLEEIEGVLGEGFCQHCEDLLESRLRSISERKLMEGAPANDVAQSLKNRWPHSYKETSDSSNDGTSVAWSSKVTPNSECSSGQGDSSSHMDVDNKRGSSDDVGMGLNLTLNDGLSRLSNGHDGGLSEEEKEKIRLSQVRRKKDFYHIERVDGRKINVVQGLELHTNVFNDEEQKNIVQCVYDFQRMGQKKQLRARTYSEPRKWMRGKGRVTIQFGCCYNYALDKDGNPPGIVRDEQVDQLPPLFKQMIKRMVRWQILPPTCVPNSCIVNIYDEGDCIPPHIDHHDFVRPFCTVSFLTEANILFGSNLKILSPGEFSGPVSIPLPLGSVLILNGNGADIAKHCVPGVPGKRISITFRKMDDGKLPYRFKSDMELEGLKPLKFPSSARSTVEPSSVWQRTQSSLQPILAKDLPTNHKEEDTRKKEERTNSTAENHKRNSILQHDEFLDPNDFPSLRTNNFARKVIGDILKK